MSLRLRIPKISRTRMIAMATVEFFGVDPIVKTRLARVTKHGLFIEANSGQTLFFMVAQSLGPIIELPVVHNVNWVILILPREDPGLNPKRAQMDIVRVTPSLLRANPRLQCCGLKIGFQVTREELLKHKLTSG